MLKVIIAGGRDIEGEVAYTQLSALINSSFPNLDVEVVSGCAPGVDTLGERFAKENNLVIHEFKADWATFGKYAGPRRNRQMAAFADALILFWDGKSKGSANMLAEARKKNLSIRQYLWKNT